MKIEIIFWTAFVVLIFAEQFAICLFMEWLRRKRSQPKSGRIEFIFSATTKKAEPMKATIKTTTEYNIPVLAKFTTIAGIVATIIGVPAWKSSDETVATVTPDETGNGATVVTVAPGSATISMHAEGDATEGVDPLDDSFDIIVVEPEAAVASITVGTPVLKTAAAPTDGAPAAAAAPLPPPV